MHRLYFHVFEVNHGSYEGGFFFVVMIEIVLAITHISAERFALLLDLITVLV